MQVRERTSNFNSYTFGGSHVMEYGNTSIKAEKLYLYQGFDPATVNFPPNELSPDTHMEAVNQRDADILFLWHMVSLGPILFSCSLLLKFTYFFGSLYLFSIITKSSFPLLSF